VTLAPFDENEGLSRWVRVGRVSRRLSFSPLRDDDRLGDLLLVVAPDAPRRHVMVRVFSSWASSRAWREELVRALPLLQSPPPGIPRLVDAGTDAEGRVCLVLEEIRALPDEIAAPQNAAEGRFLAARVADIVEAWWSACPASALAFAAEDVRVSDEGRVAVWRAGIPLEVAAPAPSETYVVQHVAASLPLWHVDVPRPRVRTFDNLREAIEGGQRPERWSAPLIEARRALHALADADVDGRERIVAARLVARAPSVSIEALPFLVRALNEPGLLPTIVRDILVDWATPVALRIDHQTRLIVRCPHNWASTEHVEVLGGTAVERYCPDCDAPVVLPQSLHVFADRSDAAAAFA
jgi:hypothetical protein